MPHPAPTPTVVSRPVAGAPTHATGVAFLPHPGPTTTIIDAARRPPHPPGEPSPGRPRPPTTVTGAPPQTHPPGAPSPGHHRPPTTAIGPPPQAHPPGAPLYPLYPGQLASPGVPGDASGPSTGDASGPSTTDCDAVSEDPAAANCVADGSGGSNGGSPTSEQANAHLQELNYDPGRISAAMSAIDDYLTGAAPEDDPDPDNNVMAEPRLAEAPAEPATAAPLGDSPTAAAPPDNSPEHASPLTEPSTAAPPSGADNVAPPPDSSPARASAPAEPQEKEPMSGPADNSAPGGAPANPTYEASAPATTLASGFDSGTRSGPSPSNTPLEENVQSKLEGDMSSYEQQSPLYQKDEKDLSSFVKSAATTASAGIVDDALAGERPSAETLKNNVALGLGSAVKDVVVNEGVDAALPPDGSLEQRMLNSYGKGLSAALDYAPSPAAMLEKMNEVRERLTEPYKQALDQFTNDFKNFKVFDDSGGD
jgi:hypothetical protein